MEILREKLKEVALLPYEVYEPRLDLAVGALGLEMNGVYSMLNKMQIEFSHAQEYMERGQQKDVKETLEEYSDNLGRMTVRLEKCRNTLEECRKENENVVLKVNDFLEHYEKSLTALKDMCDSADWEEKIAGVQEKLTQAVFISRQYIGLHLGDTSRME